MARNQDTWVDVLRGKAPRSQAALDAYDEGTLFFWLPVSFLYLAVIILQLFGRESYQGWVSGFDWAMSALFLGDYVIRLKIAPDRRKFAMKPWNIADLFVIATPVIATVTPVQWSGVLRIFRIVRLTRIAKRVWDSGQHVLGRGQVKWVAVVALAVVALAWLTVWVRESAHPDASIKTPFDALWWAIVTMFTVGYGEVYPHTAVGKVAAIVLMFTGITLFGAVTAALASLFVESGSEKEAKLEHERLEQRLDDMAQQLRRVELAISALSDDDGDSAQR
jgi:voltage-gated potassium channel